MEALAAISLAGNIVQFLDFAGQVISKTGQIYNSSSGSLDEHDRQKCVISHLKTVTGKIKDADGPSDPVLEKLCSGCSEVADELLNALEGFTVKVKHSRSQSLRKVLKAMWGKEKLQRLEDRVAGFRQELILHVTIDLRARIDVSSIQQFEAFQRLDDAIKQAATQILDAVQESTVQVSTATETQSIELRTLHTQTQDVLKQELETATVLLKEQNVQHHTIVTNEGRESRTEVLDAIAGAVCEQDRAISAEAQKVSGEVREEHQHTRAEITKRLDVDQERMAQEITGLRRGLHQLELEIDRKVEELKSLVIKINNKREGPDRQLLKLKGNSATMILRSLYELYTSLKELLKPLLQRVQSLFGTTVLESYSNTMPLQDMPLVPQPVTSVEQDNFSLSMYYAFYYKPMFQNRSRITKSEMFSPSKMHQWMQNLDECSQDDGISSDALAVLDLARNGDQLVWALASIVACLSSNMPDETVTRVMGVVFSIQYDPRCVLPAWSSACSTLCLTKCTEHPLPSIPTSVGQVFAEDGLHTKLQRPRYGPDCVIGQRLIYDITLWCHLARVAGLQEDVAKLRSHFSQYRSTTHHALVLLGLLAQKEAWDVQLVCDDILLLSIPPLLWSHDVFFHGRRLYVRASGGPRNCNYVVNVLESLGMRIEIGVVDRPLEISADLFGKYEKFILFYTISHGSDTPTLRTLARNKWYASRDYSDELKGWSWWP